MAFTHIPSRTIGPSAEEARQIYASPDNSFFGFLKTSGARTEQGTREQFARSHYHGRSQTTGPSVYDMRQAHATTDNSFFGYLDAVQAEEEVGTSQFIGSGVHSKSKTVDNMVFPKKDTAGAKGESGNPTNGTSTPESDAPSSGSIGTSTEKLDNKKTGTTKFVSSDDPRIGTTDSDGNFYMPDDISGGGFTASAKRHAYRKAHEQASNVDKWQQSELDKIDNLKKPENMKAEDWEKQQQQRRDAVNKQAGQIINNWETMRGDSTKISPGVSDYVLGNPHAVATVGGVGTLGFLALQLSDSRGQMTNQQLYGQDDLT